MKTHNILSFLLPLLLVACLSPLGGTPTVEAGVTPTPSPLPTLTPTRRVVTPPATCFDRAVFGDPADSPYILPYPVGLAYEVNQKYCQHDSSHSNQLSYDFAMALGDVVTAARSGRVMELVDSFADDGTDSGAMEYNYVLILHEDGTVAFYAHLMQDSVVVEVGDQVEAGQPIARVGFSGMPADVPPCLHFGVYAYFPPVEGHDVPVNFRNTAGRLDARNGLTLYVEYEALPWTP
jgi:murein DD-endopeptidase MepM/ murein hydrolase activator NlpD